MRGSVRMLVAAAAAVALLLMPGAASAAPASSLFQVVGTEIAFTSTEGTFVGTAQGNAGDTGTWKAVVDHTPLSSLPATITGGSFKMATVSLGLTTDSVQATFAGGTIGVVNPGLGCSKQTFAVTGNLGDVATSTSGGGSGLFSVFLTHYRVSLFGQCLTYAASVTGTASFNY
jgi:hypothetical protein